MPRERLPVWFAQPQQLMSPPPAPTVLPQQVQRLGSQAVHRVPRTVAAILPSDDAGHWDLAPDPRLPTVGPVQQVLRLQPLARAVQQAGLVPPKQERTMQPVA